MGKYYRCHVDIETDIHSLQCVLFLDLQFGKTSLQFFEKQKLFRVCMWTTTPPFRENTNKWPSKSAFLCVLALHGRSSKAKISRTLPSVCKLPWTIWFTEIPFSFGEGHTSLRFEEKFQWCSEGEIGTQ